MSIFRPVKHGSMVATSIGAAVGVLLQLSLGGVAGAAGEGYGGAGAGSVTGPSGASFPIATVLTTSSNGDSGKAVVGASTVNVSIPAGTFPSGDDLVVGNSASFSPPPGETHVVSLFIAVYQNGTKIAGAFSHAVQVVVKSPNIKAGDTVDQYVNGGWQPLVGAVVTNGQALVLVTSDPTIEVVQPPAATVAYTLQVAKTIKDGARGSLVRRAQVLLNRHGAKLVVDGIFGPKTLAALRRFQKKSGLAPNGVIAKSSWEALAR